jgi:hypothetical protein
MSENTHGGVSGPGVSAPVVDLVDAGVPADQGLSSLGLLLQLAGNVLAAYGGLLAFMMMFMMGGRNDQTLWIFLILGGSVARSLLQRSAGSQLLYGAGSLERMAGIRRYILFSAAQTLGVALILWIKMDAPGWITLGIAGGLIAWPAMLAGILAMPRFKRFREDLPLTEDKGFEGTSILMTVLGLCGLCATGTILIVLLDLPGSELQKGPGVLVVLALGMLVVRSVIHVQAGMSGLRETSVDHAVELANRYANFGVISSFCAAGAMLMFAMAGSINFLFLAVVSGVCWMLMAWPMIIRRFYSDRQFADLLAGEAAPLHRRAPDAGLTSLGWLLIAHAGFTVSFLLPQLAFGADRHGAELQRLFALGGSLGLRSIWWSIGLVVLQAWAGYELVRMSPHSRILATVFGVVGSAVTLYISWPLVQMLKHSHGFLVQGTAAVSFGPVVIALIIPVATLVLVNRKIAPTAKARFRPRPAPTPSEPVAK